MNNEKINELINKLLIQIKKDIVQGDPDDFIKLLLMNVDLTYIEDYLAKKNNDV